MFLSIYLRTRTNFQAPRFVFICSSSYAWHWKVCCRQKLAMKFRLVNFSGFSSKNWSKSGTRIYKGILNGLRYNSSEQELNLCNYCLCISYMISEPAIADERSEKLPLVAKLKLWTSDLKWNGLKHENKQVESSTDLK